MTINKPIAIHTPTLGKKILVQEVLIKNGWKWEGSWGAMVNKSPDTVNYPYVTLEDIKRKRFTAHSELRMSNHHEEYNIISLEEFLSNI